VVASNTKAITQTNDLNLEKNKFKWWWSKRPIVNEIVGPNQIISRKKNSFPLLELNINPKL